MTDENKIISTFKQLEQFTPLQCAVGKMAVGILFDSLKGKSMKIEELKVVFSDHKMALNLIDDESDRATISSLPGAVIESVLNIIDVTIEETKNIVEQLEQKGAKNEN